MNYMAKFSKEDQDFIKENEDKNADSKWRSYLKSKGVICANVHNGMLTCIECGAVWSPNIMPGGKYRRGYTKCPSGCNY